MCLANFNYLDATGDEDMMTRKDELSAKSPVSMIPKAALAVGHQFDRTNMPPKAKQHLGAELGGRSAPPKLVQRD
jgi:hypothetical protein